MSKTFKILILVFALFLASCANYKKKISDKEDNLKSNEIIYIPDKIGSFSIAMRAPKTLNPILNEDTTIDNVLKLVFENLFILDDTLKPIPNLVNYVEYSEDGKSVILYMREDVFWSDGVKLTAEDVIFTLDAIKKSPYGMYKRTTNNILNYFIIDNNTLKINLNYPTGGQGYDFCFPIIPKHYYEDALNFNCDKNMKPLGNGAFIFDSYRLIREMKLIANYSYFKGEPYIRNIDVVITPDCDTDFYAFEQGIIDVLLSSLVEWGKYGSVRDVNLINIDTNYFDFIGFNFNRSIFKDKSIREAIAYLVPKNEIIEKAYLGKAIISNVPINPNSWLYKKNLKVYDYDQVKSKKLFLNKGYNLNKIEESILKIQSEIKFKLIVNEENVERLKIAEILKNNLQNLGIYVDMVVLDFDTYLNMLKNKDFDIFIGGFSFSANPNMDFAFHSSQIKDGQNFFSYKNEELDDILLSIKNSKNEECYLKNLSEFQKHIAENIPIISLAFRQNVLLLDKNIKAEVNSDIDNIYSNVNKWFIIKKSQKGS